VRAIKTVKQTYHPTPDILRLLEEFRLMVNDCLRVGMEFERQNHWTPSMKRLSQLCYRVLKRYSIYSAYRLTAIARAAGMLASRRKSIRRGYFVKSPYMSTPLLVSCYHLKIKEGRLRVQFGNGLCELIPLHPPPYKPCPVPE